MKQSASARHHKRQLLARAASFGARHKIITALSVCIIVLASAIGWLWYANYSQKFSKEDFDQLTTMAEGVLNSASSSNVQIYRACRYVHDEFGTPPTLECQVKAVSYLEYVDDKHAIEIAQLFQDKVAHTFGTPKVAFSNIFSRPNTTEDSIYVQLSNSLHNATCVFSMNTNRFAKDAVTFLPEKTSDNLIALSFECGGPSRAAYFQMVD